MDTFPFAGMMGGGDPFDPYEYPLADYYDPSCPFAAIKNLIPREEVPKVEEPTSPAYAAIDPQLQQPLQQPKLEEEKESVEVKQEGIVELNEACEAQPQEEEEEVRPTVEEWEKEQGRAGRAQKGKKIGKQRDDDYKPYRRTSKSRVMAKQKEDRNLIPNTVHHLLAFVQKQFKSAYLIDRIFPAVNPNPAFSISRYYNFHRMLRGQINNYVNEEAMKTITEPGALPTHEYGMHEQSFYCRLSRIVARRFLKVEAVLMILRSRKVRRENILEHLSVQRYLYENMLAISESSLASGASALGTTL